MTDTDRARQELLERLRRLREEHKADEPTSSGLPVPPTYAPPPPRPWSEVDDEEGEEE